MNKNTTWSITTKIIVILLLLAGALWLLVTIQPVLTALVIAAMVAYIFNPLINSLARRTRLKRPVAARLVFFIFLLILAAILSGVGTVAVDQFQTLQAEFLDALLALEQWISEPIDLLGYRFYPEVVITDLEQAVGNTMTWFLGGSVDLFTGITNNLLWVLLLIFGLYYLMLDGQKLVSWLTQWPPEQYQADFRRLLTELDEVWGVFLRVQLLMFVVLGVMMGAGFLIVIWFFRSGLIPFSPLALILLFALVVTIAQQIDNLWMRPQLMGKSLHIHPLLIFTGLTAALMVGGLLAAFLVVPAMGSVKILGRYLHRRLFDLPPWDEPTREAGEELPDTAAADQEEAE
ncbi:MAG: AI-2E family transporter [Anaerolineales bacterium]|nr:AI-2E family transporter [Anaerolineales bacterium]